MGGTVNLNYWTRERVINGLERFIHDIAGDDETKLPASLADYSKMIPPEAKNQREGFRLFPPYAAVTRHFGTFAAAWWALGYLVEVKSSAKKYNLTDEIKQRLIEIYEFPFKSKERPEGLPGVKEYARQLGLPEHVLSKWAVELGLSHLKEAPWSEEEIDLLDKFGYFSLTRIVLKFKERGFTRSELGIMFMRKRRMSHKSNPYYSVNALAQLFGVDAHGVKAWIDKGYLKFIFKGTKRSSDTKQGGDTRLVHRDWIYDFIIKHPTAFRIRQVDQLWFLHIVTQGDVKLAISQPNRISLRSECQQVDAPIEHAVQTPRMKRKNAAAERSDDESDSTGLPYMKTDKVYDHGTNACYTINKCRCEPCTTAKRDYNRELDEKRRQGLSDPRVPAATAQAHIEKLSVAGIGYLRISKLAGVNHNIVWKIKTGERTKIRVSTETKILGITEADISDGTTIDATATWEKLNWILAQGMTKTALGRRLGINTPAIKIGRKQVFRKTAAKVEEIYNDVVANGVRADEKRQFRGHNKAKAAAI